MINYMIILTDQAIVVLLYKLSNKLNVSINRKWSIKFETECVQMLCVTILFQEFFRPDFGYSRIGSISSSTMTVENTDSPLRIDFTWISSKYIKFWSCLAFFRGKMVFLSSRMTAIHYLSKIKWVCGDRIYDRKRNGEQ